ncbi:MAG: DNA-binding transcriptional regulator Fis [Halieaceae bacterium]|jgi:Fis family transcriptional regulator, factor for inversion stimulation protein|nr:DNA-binding transcriptional regulator Fis [Halieaceae bacterium]
MSRAEILLQSPAANDESMEGGSHPQHSGQGQSLRDSVTVAVGNYLEELDGQMPTDVYQMVLAQLEAPLLEQIMAYTRNNQTKASIMLGLNRGTLRKKLKQYNLLDADA